MSKTKTQKVIGVFEGICADAEITNENGLDITRAVWETVFASDLYKTAIELGHYIGFLGHPDDPGAMNFQDACIVMKEGHIEDDGKVYGKFDLVDTPVGRVVKTFIDAGVKFGISVRGAGDIIDNSVDPETFVFRGFDLVTFPAYKEAIPEFQAIAASTDTEKQKQYKKVCAAIEKDLPNITSCGAIDIIQEQVPEQSEVYDELETRKNELLEEPETGKTLEEEKIDSLTSLYLEEKERADEAEAKLGEEVKLIESEKIKMSKKLHAMTRIVAAQERDVNSLHNDLEAENKSLSNKNKITAAANAHLKKQLHDEKETNLQYLTKIEASEKILSKKDSTIRELQDKLDETVTAATQATKRASNLDGKVKDLEDKVLASQQLIAEYQDAYASLYAQAVGSDLHNVSVTASTSVADLQKKIVSSSARSAVLDDFDEPHQVDDRDENFDDESDLVAV